MKPIVLVAFNFSEIAQVIAAYTATGAEQLTLAPGQLILIRKKNPGGWWEGELQVHEHLIKLGSDRFHSFLMFFLNVHTKGEVRKRLESYQTTSPMSLKS